MKNKFSIAMTLAVIMAMLVTSLALADNLQGDDLNTGGNATKYPGQTGTAQFYLVANGNDGCNADSNNPVTVTVSSNQPWLTIASSGQLSLTGCGIAAKGTINYTVASNAPVSGVATVQGIATGGKSGNNGFNNNPGDFSVTVVALPNTAPTVTVTGVTNGASYEFGSVPAATCAVTDAEDGPSSFVASLSAISGPNSAFGLGSQTASCSYTDGGGLSDSDSAAYSIVDTTIPAIDAHADETAEATGPTGAVVNYTSPATHDAVFGDGFATCSPASGSLFALGDTTVTCNASDGVGNPAAPTTFIVHVVDTTPPTIEAHGDETAEATSPAGALVTYTAPTTSDAVSGAGTATCTPASGSQFVLGDTTVTCNAADAAGNPATATMFVVHVVDTTDPTFDCGSADSLWHADDQSVACTASDNGSGLATPATFSLTTSVPAGSETDNAYTNSAEVCDLSGNCVTAGPIGPFKIDKKAPTVSATPDRSADFGGWYNHALSITFTATDGGSGVASCDPAINYSGPDTAAASAAGACVDNVGNSGNDSFSFMYDGTAPTATLSVTGGIAGANGWYVSDVTVHTSGTGSVSGVTCTGDQYQTAETTGVVFNGSCTSGAGLTTNAAPLTVKLDKTAPTNVVLSAAGTLGNNGWYISDVIVTTSGTDDISAPVTCTAPQSQTADTDGATFNGTCTNDAGLTTGADALTIKRDATAPLISAALSPARPASGWWNIASGAPTVTYTCSDATSGVASCTPASTFAEGENQTHNGSVVDNAGNSASTGVSDVDVDLTAPSLTWNGGPANGASFYFGSVPAAPTCSAADTLSGPNTCTVVGYSTTVGTHTMTASAYDAAGNTYSEQRTYTVMAWTLKGFYQPIDMNNVLNTVKGGSTVPLKFEVFAGPTELTDTAVISTLLKQVTCNATAEDTIEVLATGGTSLRYDTTGGQFIFNWQTPKLPGKCYSVTMTTQDGSSITALFKLK